MSVQRSPPSPDGRRIVVCDYNTLLQSVTGLLRMSGYCVFQAYDGRAVEELCAELPKIELLVLNTYGTGVDTGVLIRRVRATTPHLPVLHIGDGIPEGLPPDVPTLAETFTSQRLLAEVAKLMGDETRAAPAAGTPAASSRQEPD